MNFTQLYTNCSEQIKETILRMWSEYALKMVEQYKDQLETMLKDNISNNIVVEDMSRWEPVENDDWKDVVDPKLWRKIDKDGATIISNPHAPYKHQYECWKASLKDGKSFVVTSGTGSGKTECFMVPILQDLAFVQDPNRDKGVEALFLYPLNALMEDQRERINNFIKFSENGRCAHNIQFAVFNGSTAEKYSDTIPKLDHELVDRASIRREKPNILFTNPSMLEYMLLRKKDKSLFSNSLKWIVIDEAHTYSGSAGAELALLLRRVLKACGKQPIEVRFATSSATIGNDDGQLKRFIADITGQQLDDIEIIKGRRTMPKSLSDEQADKLHKDNFVLLNELFPTGTLQEKLKQIDDLADQELRVRLHYFIKCLTSGFYINPTAELVNGQFKLHTNIPLKDGKLDPHYLSACYCSECGAILGYGVMDDDNKYSRDIKSISTLEGEFDEVDDDSNNDGTNSSQSKSREFFIGIVSPSSPLSQATVKVDDNNIIEQQGGKFVYSKKKKNNEQECPCCGASGKEKFAPLHSFHLSTDFISRLIAPILLNQVSPHENSVTEKTLPSKGCKYITFADSRQSAAGPTLKQNLETEEVWVTGVLYKKLYNHRPLSEDEFQRYSDLCRRNRFNNDLSSDERKEYNELKSREEIEDNYLTWDEAMNALMQDANFKSMYLSFASNKEEEADGDKKYALSALYRTMNKRPHGKNSPENWGLISTCYPTFENTINQRPLPDAVENFNALVADPNLGIRKEDWYDFVKLFIDYEVRTHQKMFFKLDSRQYPAWEKIDWKDVRSYRTEDGTRRPIHKPAIAAKGKKSRFVMLLCKLLGKDRWEQLNAAEKSAVEAVINALWDVVTECAIAEKSQEIEWTYVNGKKDRHSWVSGNATDLYMNMANIAFKLYDEKVFFDNNLKVPLDTTLKGFSPYDKDGVYEQCEIVDWPKFIKPGDSQTIREWFDQNREKISHRWTVKLERIFKYISESESENSLYIQAEHTAQVARSIIKDKTDKFKAGKINIMACSTTMEMGVDLGELELVLMNNVPPHPSNYKQRAGRAGRGSQNKSASLTLCGADSLGKNLLDNPVKDFIQEEMAPPKIGLRSVSPQLVQRHINSALLRQFIVETNLNTAIGQGDAYADDRGFRMNDFFTSYTLSSTTNPNKRNKSYVKVGDANGATVFPSGYADIRNHQGSLYNAFLNKLSQWQNDAQSNAYELVLSLIKETSLEGSTVSVLIENTKNNIKAIAEDIHTELEAIRDKWDPAIHENSGNPTESGSWLYWQFANVFNGMFFSYLSNHQFTPNANMPVGIVEMILKENSNFWSKSENPTRDLRTALAEYAPGNLVFIDGRTYRMAGVKWNEKRPALSVYHCAQGHTWISSVNDNCPICNTPSQPWDNRPALPIITPMGYYPSSDVSRITKKEPVKNEIGVELIGVGNWADNKTHKLFTHRTNVDTNNSQILYYDKGQGFGYHICKKCGYAVPATSLNDGTKDDEVCDLMYSEATDRNSVKYWHHNYRKECKMEDPNNPLQHILQNIVLGSSIQTDYCEIALYTNEQSVTQRMVATPENLKIVTTLGLLLCKSLSHRFGFDRGEVDFLCRNQNSELSICIFDVAKGGSGRSKLLPGRITEFFDWMRTLLNGNVAIEHILDRGTMRYAEYLDIVGAREWLEQEYKSRVIIPNGFPTNVHPSSYVEIENAVQQESNADNVYIFVNNQFADWNYRCAKEHPCWLSAKMGMIPRGADKYNLVVLNAPRIVPAEYYNFPDSMNIKQTIWNNIHYYPLAQIGNDIYITNVKDYSYLDEHWATDGVWKCSINDVSIDVQDWTPIHDAEKMHEIEIAPGTEIMTNTLLNKLLSEALNLFLSNREHYNRLTIECSDRYLISQLGMIITHQLINRIVDLVKVQDYTIKYNINTTPTQGPSSRADDLSRRLFYTIDHRDLLNFAEAFLNPNNDDRIKVVSKEWKEFNHDRWLSIEANTGHKLIIKPDGGFQRGWHVDRMYTPDNSPMNAEIPIIARDTDGRLVYYLIYKRPSR